MTQTKVGGATFYKCPYRKKRAHDQSDAGKTAFVFLQFAL